MTKPTKDYGTRMTVDDRDHTPHRVKLTSQSGCKQVVIIHNPVHGDVQQVLWPFNG